MDRKTLMGVMGVGLVALVGYAVYSRNRQGPRLSSSFDEADTHVFPGAASDQAIQLAQSYVVEQGKDPDAFQWKAEKSPSGTAIVKAKNKAGNVTDFEVSTKQQKVRVLPKTNLTPAGSGTTFKPSPASGPAAAIQPAAANQFVPTVQSGLQPIVRTR
jgi:hypothetical protein